MEILKFHNRTNLMKQNKIIGHIHFIPNCLSVGTNAVIFEKKPHRTKQENQT